MQDEERPEPPAGTLATALAVIDDWFAEGARTAIRFRSALTTDPEVDAEISTMLATWSKMLAAWSTTRAAAMKSLEPVKDAEVDQDSISLRAHRLAKVAQDRISLLIGDPSPDSEAAIRVANLAIAPSMTALMLEALEQISDQVTQNAVSMESIAKRMDDTLRELPAIAIDIARRYGAIP